MKCKRCRGTGAMGTVADQNIQCDKCGGAGCTCHERIKELEAEVGRLKASIRIYEERTSELLYLHRHAAEESKAKILDDWCSDEWPPGTLAAEGE